jgi:hypothetical protein
VEFTRRKGELKNKHLREMWSLHGVRAAEFLVFNFLILALVYSGAKPDRLCSTAPEQLKVSGVMGR